MKVSPNSSSAPSARNLFLCIPLHRSVCHGLACQEGPLDCSQEERHHTKSLARTTALTTPATVKHASDSKRLPENSTVGTGLLARVHNIFRVLGQYRSK